MYIQALSGFKNQHFNRNGIISYAGLESKFSLFIRALGYNYIFDFVIFDNATFVHVNQNIFPVLIVRVE
jgi:hypothetical protein